MSERRGPVRVGEIVGSFLADTGIQKRLERFDVLERWPDLVGDRIAAVTRARGLSEDTLFVEVRSSAWLTELTMMKGDILERINEDREADARIGRLVFVQGEG